jgi:uncharacterized membrane protein YvlD (DUF360 family)
MTAEQSFPSRCLINAAALWLASLIVSGMQMPAQALACLVTLLIFVLIYELVHPLLSIVTFPLALVLIIPVKIAAYMLILIATVAASRFLGASLVFNGFLAIFWAAVAVGLIRLLLTESVRLYETRQTLRRQRKWMQELRQASAWLAEQVGNWHRIVEERQRVLHEQQAWIEELQGAKAWLASQIARHSGNGSN